MKTLCLLLFVLGLALPAEAQRQLTVGGSPFAPPSIFVFAYKWDGTNFRSVRLVQTNKDSYIVVDLKPDGYYLSSKATVRQADFSVIATCPGTRKIGKKVVKGTYTIISTPVLLTLDFTSGGKTLDNWMIDYLGQNWKVDFNDMPSFGDLPPQPLEAPKTVK